MEELGYYNLAHADDIVILVDDQVSGLVRSTIQSAPNGGDEWYRSLAAKQVLKKVVELHGVWTFVISLRSLLGSSELIYLISIIKSIIMSNKCKICAGIVNRKRPGLQCSSFCEEYYHGQCLGLTINQLDALRFEGVLWNCSDCRGDRILPSRRSLQTITPNPFQQLPQPPVKSRSSQADSNRVFDALQQIREEMRLFRDSVSFCSDKITDSQSDLTSLREYVKNVDKLVAENIQLKDKVDTLTVKFDELDQVSRVKNGSHTVALAVAYTIHCLAHNPEVQKKTVDEQEEIFGDIAKAEPTFDDMDKMEYLDMVIKESLRLYPPVPGILRDLSQGFEYEGNSYQGVTMVAAFLAAQRDPRNFSDPLKFDPDRFKDYDFKKSFVYLPFSAGPRRCMGRKFAMVELKSVLSKFVRNYEVVPPTPPQPLSLLLEFNTKSKTGVHVSIKRRGAENNPSGMTRRKAD
ncbi:hypothetical protein JTB14_032437 [Gonioctena quinquepunctata]|nr:hypothetical protein JTB14_032437 [Gonioctena quinquepunctata]